MGATVLVVAALAALLELVPYQPGGAQQLGAMRTALPVIGAAAILVQVLPSRAQPLLLAGAVVALQHAWGGWLAVGWRAAGIVVVAVLGALLPLGQETVRRATILIGVLCWPIIIVADLPRQLVGPAVQLVFLGAMTTGLRLGEGLRYGLACSMLPTISVPPGEALRVDRSPRSVLVGGGMLVGGLGLLTGLSPFAWIPSSDPWFALWSGQPWRVPDLAIAVTLHHWPPVLGRLVAVAGLLRLFGVAVSSPVDAPWRATNFLEWWRRTHTWRSRLFREGFFLQLGWTGPAAVFLVFLLSGLQHVASGQGIEDLLRWTVDGAVSAGTFVVLQRRAARRARAWVERREVVRDPAWRAWVGLILVLIGQGLLWSLVA